MKIFYDYQIFCIQDFGGISKYFSKIIHYFQSKAVGIEPLVAIKFTNNYHLQQEVKDLKTLKFLPSTQVVGKYRALDTINRFFTIKKLKTDFDLFHPTYYNPYFLKYLNQKPFVLTVHDMIHELFPDYYPTHDQTTQHKKQLADQAAKIIAISENTKKDLVRLLGIPPEKIEVIYHGCTLSTRQPKPGPALPKDYFLFVGQRAGYKNFQLLLTAFRSLLPKYPHLALVCVGKPFSPEERLFLEKHELAQQVIHRQLSDDELAWAYGQAICLVYPSLYEGFGIPILEAFHNACPTVLSRASCFPEIALDAAIYFEPDRPESLQEALEKIYLDKKLRQKLIERGQKRAQDFSWKKTARATLKVYQSVIG